MIDLQQEIEIEGVSCVGWSDATQIAVDKAHKTLSNIESGYVQDHSLVQKPDGTTEYKVNVKITYKE